MSTDTAARRSAPDGRVRPTAGPSRPRWTRLLSSAFRAVAGTLIVLVVAELLLRAELIGGSTLPPPSAILDQMADLALEANFRDAFVATLRAWAVGLAIAIAIGVPVGLLLGLSNLASRVASPVIELMRPLPAVALIPLAILVWGQGFSMKLVLIVYATVWPILFNAIHGVHDVDPNAVDAARSFGLRRLAVIRRVVLPSAAPFVLTGIRVSASIGLIVLVGAELLAGASSGIGAYIFRLSANTTDSDAVLAAAAYAGILGIVINSVLVAIDRRLFAWQHARSDA